jgi:hypothetical protein
MAWLEKENVMEYLSVYLGAFKKRIQERSLAGRWASYHQVSFV